MKDATPEEIYFCVEAELHSALDEKYALSDDIIRVAYIHPLSPLRNDQLIDAIAQVRSAALTNGTLYTGTDLAFPGRNTGKDKGKKLLFLLLPNPG